MSQWGQYPMQTGFNPQQQQQQPGFPGGVAPQQTGFPGQQPQGFLQSQPTGYPGAPGFQQQQQPQQRGFQQPQQTGFQQPQQTGFQQPQQTGFQQFQQPQQTGYPSNFGQQPPPVPPLPNQFQQQNVGPQPGFLGAQQQPNRFMSTSPAMGGSALMPQQTGFQGVGGGFGGGAARPLVPQATGFVNPLLTMMSNTFMPANPSLPYSGGAPQFQQQSGPSLQQNFQQHNQAQRGTAAPKVPWTLSKAEKKNYDGIFRAWDTSGSGFISGSTALEVFGQSGLDKNELARVWALADGDNRGKLNLAEFHVAMGLIYRRLNGNDLPEELPDEMVPPSARGLGDSVDFVKDILKSDSRSNSYGTPVSKMRERSFGNSSSPGAGTARDATIYKHDDTTQPTGGVYQPRSRHVDRSMVRVRSDDPAEDLSVMKKQLENTARLLDRTAEERETRTREDEELEREMEDLKYRIKRLQDDLDYVSRGPKSFSKDEERRKLERELVDLMYEKLPSLEKRIEENQARKDKDKRDQNRDRDRRNDRFGRFDRQDDSYSSSRYGEDDGRRSRGGNPSRDRSRDERDRDDRRDYDRYDRRDDRDRDYGRPRSPPAARSPPPAPPSIPATSISKPPPAPPAPTASPAAKMTPEERKAFVQAEAQRRTQERMRALGLHTSTTPTPEFSDVSDRLAQEKREAEEKALAAEKAEADRIRIRQERLANEKALKEGTSPTISTPSAASTIPAPTPKSTPKPTPPVPKSRAPAPPPPRKPPIARPPVVARSPVPPPAPVIVAPPAPPPAPEVDPEEERLLAKEAELKKKREAREARIRELERQEEEEAREAELEFQKRKEARQRSAAPSPAVSTPSAPAPPPSRVAVSPAPPPPSAPEATSPAPPLPPPAPPAAATPSDKPSTNPFNRFLGDPSAATPSPAASVSAPNGGTNPFFRSTTAPPPSTGVPPKSSTPVSVKTHYNTAPADDDDDWDAVIEKEEDDSSDDEFSGSRDKRKNLAEKFFGNILPPARPQSAGPVAGASSSQPQTPVHAAAVSIPDPPPAPPAPSAPPAPPAPPAPSTSALPPPAAAAGRGALFDAIQGGARLRKTTVINDRSSTGLAGRVIGDTAPPPHITAASLTSSPSPQMRSSELEPPSPPRAFEENDRANSRLSVAWYGGLAADHGELRDLTLPSMVEEEDEPEPAPRVVPHIQVESVGDGHDDPMEDVDRSVEYRVRSLYPYEGQRVEDLSFGENLMLTAHPSKSGGDWWYGTVVRDAKSGFFPQTYVARVKPVKAIAAFAYPGNNTDELPFNEGDQISIIDQSEGDWWKAEQEGVVFIVPAAYLQVVEDATTAPLEVTDLVENKHVEQIETPKSPAEQPAEDENSSDTNSEEDSESESEYLSFSEVEGNDEASEEQHRIEREVREKERQRVLEAAGLIVKKDERRPPPRIPRSRGHRPPPAIPHRSSVASDLSAKDLSVTPTEPEETESVIRLDDAFERYEAFKFFQSQASPTNRLSTASFDTSSTATPVAPSPTASTFSKVPSDAGDTRSYSSFLNFLGRSKTPGNESEKRPTLVISAPILGPINNRSPSPVPRDNTPGFGTSWASLVDKSALEGIPTSERKRQEAIFELINTESAYIRDLQLIVEIFYSSMIPLLDEKAVTVIFANVEDLLLINTTFLSSLEERQKECRLYVDNVGDILQTHIPNMAAYMEYCVNEGTAIKLLQSMRNSNPELGSHLNRLRDDPSVRNLDLSSYLLVPMQRITRYPLLIRQILQYTDVAQDRGNIEQALQVAEGILGHINESIREQEGHERLKMISRDLWVGQGRLDLTAPTRNMGPRRLLHEGALLKSKSGRKLRGFLCSDILVLTDEHAKALYRMPIPLAELRVKESPGARDDQSFQIVLAYPRGGAAIGLRATSVRDCQQWIQSINSAHQKCKRADERAVKAAQQRSVRR